MEAPTAADEGPHWARIRPEWGLFLWVLTCSVAGWPLLQLVWGQRMDLSPGDLWNLAAPAYALVLFVVIRRSHSLMLTRWGMDYTQVWGREHSVAWQQVQGVTLDGRFPRRIAVELDFWPESADRPRRDRLHIGSSWWLVSRARQARIRDELERWWLRNRGVDWRPLVPPAPLTFPAGVNPYEPPTP